jgi:predicted phosphoribosyltransferase
MVLALPRGGVPVAYEVARALDAPLDVFLVRKLGIPGHEELAMGAVATGGVRVLNEQVVRALRIPDYVIDAVAAKEEHELARRERLYRGDRPPPDVRGRTVILVDDGLATGATMHAAIQALR